MVGTFIGHNGHNIVMSKCMSRKFSNDLRILSSE